MTVRDALLQATQSLVDARIEDGGLEAEVLLRHVLGLDRVRLYLALDDELDAKASGDFWRLVNRRLNGEPPAYITGHREFYGLDFDVDSNVLIPRPETELLVEAALNLSRARPELSIADVGTGSGAIAISLAVNLSRHVGTKIFATDISSPALEIARRNCLKHGVLDRISLLQGDLLDPLPEPVDLIIANLPYVREDDLSRVNTRPFEPLSALDGGADGLDVIRRLAAQVEGKLRPGGSLLLEIGAGQSKAVTDLFRGLFPSVQISIKRDWNGIERVVGVSMPERIAVFPAAFFHFLLLLSLLF